MTTDDEKAILLNPDLTKLELSGDESKDIAVVCGWFASRLVLVKLEMSLSYLFSTVQLCYHL